MSSIKNPVVASKIRAIAAAMIDAADVDESPDIIATAMTFAMAWLIADFAEGQIETALKAVELLSTEIPEMLPSMCESIKSQQKAIH